MKNNITCCICSKELSGKQTLFCSTLCKNKAHQSYEAQQNRGLERKNFLIERGGGKCSLCGYNKNSAALSFHHTDPKEKEFQLDLRSLSNRTQERIDKEVQKCILICCNCHAEIHNPQHNLQ
jgi:hypothetical protein